MTIPEENSAAVIEVTNASERFRLAMIDPGHEALDAVLADELSYGHSNGRVETKAGFVSELMEGRSDFVSIEITDQSVVLADDAMALVRHTLSAETNDSGRPARVVLKVLCVWLKRSGQWKLIARQAVRPS